MFGKEGEFKMGGIANNVGEFQHGGYWILEWGILNVHRLRSNYKYYIDQIIYFFNDLSVHDLETLSKSYKPAAH